MKPFEPPPPSSDDALVERVRARVMSAVREHGDSLVTVRAGEGSWLVIAPGVHCKLLNVTGAIAHAMVRCDPGAVFPSHLHTEDEEILVIEGSVRVDDVVLHPGDFYIARKGTVHETVSTDAGLLMYLRGAREVIKAACET